MNQDDIKNMLVFLNRVTLQGTEVPTWVKLVNTLNADLATLQAPPPGDGA